MSEIETTDKDNIYSNNILKYSNYQSETSKRKNINNQVKNKRKKLKINSVSELEFLYNDSQNRILTKTKNMLLKKKNLINYSSNYKNSTDILSPKNDFENKHSRQYQQVKPKKSTSFDIFLETVKQNKKDRSISINNLKTEAIKRQISEMRDRPRISRRSRMLANSKSREPLYLKRPLSEEKYLDGDFLIFYKKNLDFSKKKLITSNEKKIQEKFNKIYEDNLQWKKNKEESSYKIKNDYDRIKEELMNEILTFKPILNKNSKQIVQKLRKNRQMNINQYNNNLYNCGNEREFLDKLKLKLKPVLSEYFDINSSKRPYINKRSLHLLKNLTENNKRIPLSRAKSYQNIPEKSKRTNKKIIINNNKRRVPKEENKNDNIGEEEYKKYKYNKTKRKEYDLLHKFKEIKKKKIKPKKEVYKLNVRQSTSWNQDFVNFVIPRKNYRFIVEGVL